MTERGFVYVMTNPAMPGLVKVGITTKMPEKRAKDSDMSATGIPSNFEVQYYALFNDMALAERKTHSKLKAHHYNKEFFKIDVATAIAAIESLGLDFQKLFSKPENDEKATQIILKKEQQKAEKLNQEKRMADLLKKEKAESERLQKEKHEANIRQLTQQKNKKRKRDLKRYSGLYITIIGISISVLIDLDPAPMLTIAAISMIIGMYMILSTWKE